MSNEILEKPFGVPISKLNLKTFSNNHHTRTEPRLPFYQPSHIQMSVLPSLYHRFIIFSAFECGNPTSNLTEQMKIGTSRELALNSNSDHLRKWLQVFWQFDAKSKCLWLNWKMVIDSRLHGYFKVICYYRDAGKALRKNWKIIENLRRFEHI